MCSRLFCLQRLLKYNFNDTVFPPKAISCLSTVGPGDPKKSRVEIANPNLPLADDEDIDKIDKKETKKSGKRRKTPVNILTPSLNDSRRQQIQTVVGLHVGPSHVYSARVHRCGEVLDWTQRELFPIAKMARKVQLPKLYEEIYCLAEEIPFGDVYVLEGTNQGQPNSLHSSSTSAMVILRAQIYAMLVALLNNTEDAESDHSNIEPEYFHKVFFLRPRLMSRLFHLLIGTERVSALALVDSILDGTSDSSKLIISPLMNETKICDEKVEQSESVPCNSYSPPVFTPVIVPVSIKESYHCLQAVEKEGMCQALLIAMAFYDLAVFKDPKVLAPLQL